MMNRKTRSFYFCIFVQLILLWFFGIIIFTAYKVFPEISMFICSNCRNYILKNQILKKEIHQDQLNTIHGQINLMPDFLDKFKESIPLIMVGSHHKTGSYFTRKVFSRICTVMSWCCIFHPSRSTIDAVKNSIIENKIDLIGHNQWVWNPNETDIQHYKFLHFYRHPFRKIVSGYLYHRDGSEQWVRTHKDYYNICNISSLLSTQNANLTTRYSVKSYCKSIHLCESCCLHEHGVKKHLTGSSNVTMNRRNSFKLGTPMEYHYICQHLGQESHSRSSLHDRLRFSSKEDGIFTEAALDYYENLRMARIINDTWHDINTLHIDIDDLNNPHLYDITIRKILLHIMPRLSSNIQIITSLQEDLKFFNLHDSWLYRWSMSNPYHKHIHLRPQQPMIAYKNLENRREISHNNDSYHPSIHYEMDSVYDISNENDYFIDTEQDSYLYHLLSVDEPVNTLYSKVFELMSQALIKN